MGCGKGAERQKGGTFPLEKQSACNYVRADCMQRKCVCPELGARVTLHRLCVCVCVFASHLFYRRGKDVDEVEASFAHRLYRGSCGIL